MAPVRVQIRPTYQAVSLATVHHPVKDIQDFEPQTEHTVSVWKLIEIAQEDLADQDSDLNSGLAHPHRVRVVDLGLE